MPLWTMESAVTHEPEETRETPDVMTSRLLVAMVGTVAMVVVALGALYAFYRSSAPSASFIPPRTFSAPQLETKWDGSRDPAIAEQKSRLDAYAWVDREHGIVQIPIDRAMALIAARGATAYDPLSVPSAKAPP
jgi:hypothetical protein